MISLLSSKQISIIQLLGHFSILTVEQFIKLGIEKDKGNLSRLLKSLRERRKPLIRKIPHLKGIPSKHYLSKYGKEILEQSSTFNTDKEILYFKSILQFETQDMKHRSSLIDIEIELNNLCKSHKIELIFCDRYFDKGQISAKTSLKLNTHRFLIADIIFQLRTRSQNEFYILELENGLDAKKSFQKCLNYLDLFKTNEISRTYEFDSGFRTLWVFEHESTMKSVQRRISSNVSFDKLQEHFLFKTLEGFLKNTYVSWLNVVLKERKLFY